MSRPRHAVRVCPSCQRSDVPFYGGVTRVRQCRICRRLACQKQYYAKRGIEKPGLALQHLTAGWGAR